VRWRHSGSSSSGGGGSNSGSSGSERTLAQAGVGDAEASFVSLSAVVKASVAGLFAQLDEDGEGEEMSVARLSMNGVDSSRLAILLRCALFSLCFCSERLLVMKPVIQAVITSNLLSPQAP
jgi:hypothetical protein